MYYFFFKHVNGGLMDKGRAVYGKTNSERVNWRPVLLNECGMLEIENNFTMTTTQYKCLLRPTNNDNILYCCYGPSANSSHEMNFHWLIVQQTCRKQRFSSNCRWTLHKPMVATLKNNTLLEHSEVPQRYCCANSSISRWIHINLKEGRTD